MGNISESLSFGVEAILGIFIFFIIFTALFKALADQLSKSGVWGYDQDSACHINESITSRTQKQAKKSVGT